MLGVESLLQHDVLHLKEKSVCVVKVVKYSIIEWQFPHFDL